MVAYLADTNVLGELARQSPDKAVIGWAATVTAVGVSVITVEEIFFGLAWKPNPRVRRWFEEFFADCEVFPLSASIASRAGEMRGQLKSEGKTRTQADMLIAATAEHHGLTLVTRNIRDFEGCRVPVFNPFSR